MLIKNTLLIILIAFFWNVSNSSQAQQWHYYNPTFTFDVNTVEIPAPGIVVIGGGRETRDSVQVMFQSPDYGLTWHENNYDGYSPWNKSIAFSDAVNGFGVGYDGRIIATHDAGRNWGYPATPVNRDLNKIVYMGGVFYVAGGNKTRDSIQTILKSSDYGYTWDVIYDAYGPWLRSLFFMDTLKGFAVGENGVILSTTNGGNAWASVTSPVLRDFNAITFINADTGYIVGGTSSGLCRMTILRTVNGGSNWSVLIDNVGGVLNDISFADALTGYVVGDSATVLGTTDGGLNWVPAVIDTNLTGNESFNAVKFYNRNFGAIGGKAGVLYVYRDIPVEAYTLGSNQVGTTDVSLLGGINTHTKNTRCSFVYSDNINFDSPDSTQEINIQNDSLLLVSELIQGLTPSTTYYYYLKASTVSGSFYGDTLTFFTGANPHSIFKTIYATAVGTSQAYLNGLINKVDEPVSLFFEYGTSPAFGSLITATPPAVNDTLMHYIQAFLSGLRTNTRYFFRLKGVTDSGTYYGDTRFFDAINLPFANTINVNINSLTSVQLNGGVTNNGFPTAIKFQYGPTDLYGAEVSAVPDSVTGTGYFGANCILTGLSPTITYHFRIKTINPIGISYGVDKIFCTSGPLVFTYPTSNIGLSSAQLNGAVIANSFPTAIKFEYGLTELYDSEVNALPDSATGTTITNVSCSLTGLSYATTYHYRVKATNLYGTNYGTDMTFTVRSPFVSTLSASNVTAVSAQLNGLVNANNIPAVNKFDFGITPLYGNEVISIPDTSTGYSFENISSQLNGLLSNTTYYYRAKATNTFGTNYGNVMTFTTPGPMSVNTLQATDITLNSARLNGSMDAGGAPAAIKFEYGTSIAYGNEINAIPDSSNVTGSIDVYALPEGLLPNTTYHFRLKGTNSIITKFGDDKIFYTGNPEIPNFDFEMWTPLTKTKPVGWDLVTGVITQYTPACYNNYAIKIENDTVYGELPGAIVIGTVIDYHTILGGVPFNARPDTLVGCFNYSIHNDDTALVMLILKKQGSIISNNLFKITGNSSGNYVDLKFPISYTSAGNADSLIIGMSSSDFRSDPQHFPAGSYLIVDRIRFTGTTENIPNNDFENWEIKTVRPLDTWCYGTNPLHPEDTVITRSIDAQHGNYAVRIKSYIYITDTMTGWLSTSPRWNDPGFRVNAKHQSFTGYYKFMPENNDTLLIQIRMFKNHVDIGGGMFQSPATMTTYTPFKVDISYFTSDTPDSATITLQSHSGWPPLGNSVLFIDNLNFDGFLSGIKETPLPAVAGFDFNVYPNPFREQATVSFSVNKDEHVMVRLIDLSGKQVVLLADCKYKSGNYKLDLSAQGLQKGFYICVISTEGQTLSRKLIIY